MGTSIKNFNLRGMDLSDPFGDGLMYLQDAVVDSYSIRRRQPLPGLQISTTTSCAMSGLEVVQNKPAFRHLNYSGTSDCWTVLTPGTGFSNYTIAYPVSGNGSTQVGTNTAYSTTGYDSTAKMNDEVVYAGSTSTSMAVWGGSNKTTTLNSTVSTYTASTTSGSNVVTFSGAVPGLDATWEGCYIYLSGFPKRPFKVRKYFSTTKVILDTIVDFTTAGQTWCIQPFAWVGCADNVFLDSTGASLNEVACKVAVGHQGRLWAMNVKNGAIDYPHRGYYSGTSIDANSSYTGIHNWYPLSYVDIAPELGNEIVASASFGGDLIVFKDRGIAVLRGVVANSDSLKFGARVDILSDEIRCGGAWNIAKTKFGIFLFSPDGIYMITGNSIDRIDDRIWPWVRENVALESYSDGSTTGRFDTFVLDGKVYVDLHQRALPNDDGAYRYYNLYLVWDMDMDVWMTRTFTDLTKPNKSVTFTYGNVVYRFCTLKGCGGTTGYPICYRGKEENGSITTATSVATTGQDNYILFAAVTNGTASNGDYPGYVRPSIVHILHDTDTASIVDVAAIPNYCATLVTDIDIGILVDDSVLVKGSTIGDIRYGLPVMTLAPQWSRFNVGGISPSFATNLMIADGTYGGITQSRIYGISIEYEHSDVVAP